MSNNIYITSLARSLFNFLNNDVLLGSLDDEYDEYDVCFDCDLWTNGFKVNKNDSLVTVIEPLSSTLVSLLKEFEELLKDQMSDSFNYDFGYKSQIERLLNLVTDLKNKVLSITCVVPCDNNNIIAFLLSTLIQTILTLITALEFMSTVSVYFDNCGCTSIKIREIIIGKFINSITDIQCLLQDWYSIVVTFFYYSSTAIKPYIPAYVPKQHIPIPQPNPNLGFACVPCQPTPPPPPITHQPNSNCTPFVCR